MTGQRYVMPVFHIKGNTYDPGGREVIDGLLQVFVDEVAQGRVMSHDHDRFIPVGEIKELIDKVIAISEIQVRIDLDPGLIVFQSMCQNFCSFQGPYSVAGNDIIHPDLVFQQVIDDFFRPLLALFEEGTLLVGDIRNIPGGFCMSDDVNRLHQE